jgi:hypothetical protein
MNKVILTILTISLITNAWLWKRIANRELELRSRAANAVEAEQLRRAMQELEASKDIRAVASAADVNELARLRNEVGQLREQLKEMQNPSPVLASWRRLPANADWTEKFAAATNELAQREQYLDQLSSNHHKLISSLATASVEQLEELKRRAQSRECMTNLKKIGLAARIWANDHGDKFPADYLTMREELETPKVLFCPAAPGAKPVSDWLQLNPVTITYTWHGATADERQPDSELATCPIHGHVGKADGSAHMTRPNGYLP